MLGKLFGLIAVFSVATMLALSGLGVYLWSSGKMTPARIETIAAVLRGEHDAAPEDAPTTQPTSAPAASQPFRAPSADELARQRREAQVRRAGLDRAERDVRAQRELLDQALHALVQKEEAFDGERTAWLDQQKKLREKAEDAGFAKEVELVSKLDPAQAKAHLLRVWEKEKADAVRLLNALKVSAAQAIFAQMTEPQEADILHELLEAVREQQVNTETGPRTAAGN